MTDPGMTDPRLIVEQVRETAAEVTAGLAELGRVLAPVTADHLTPPDVHSTAPSVAGWGIGSLLTEWRAAADGLFGPTGVLHCLVDAALTGAQPPGTGEPPDPAGEAPGPDPLG
jgi:hypothetical protein